MAQSTLQIWIEAARPKTLPAAASPVIMGSAMAYAEGVFYWLAALTAFICALLIQIGTNYANDYYDFLKGADTENRIGPTRATQAGLVSPNAMKNAVIFVFTLAFIVGLYLVYRGGWPILAIGVASILFGILYTGGPSPLGYNGTADIFVLVFFGPIAVGGTYYVQTLDISTPVLIAGLAPGFISTAILAVNNLRDFQTDRLAGKKTLIVRFGVKFGRFEYLCCLLVSAIIPVILTFFYGGSPYAMLSLLAIVAALPSIQTVLKIAADPVLNKVLANTGKTLFLYSLLFSAGWLIP
jgi:1,4-dihydroxy-2-naphthoate octaprenyltransferase